MTLLSTFVAAARTASEPLVEPTEITRAARRRYTKEDKLRILRLVDAAKEREQVGAILRREGIYYSTLRDFQKQRANGRLEPGGQQVKRAAIIEHTQDKARIAELEAQIRQLTQRLSQAEIVIDVQKTLSAFGHQPAADRTDPPRERPDELLERANELVRQVRPTLACRALSISRATFYRRRAFLEGRPLDAAEEAPGKSRHRSARALAPEEEQKALDLLFSDRFADVAPAEIVVTLLDEGEYVCSVSILYRLLRRNCAVRERRRILRHPKYKRPELLAKGPNQLWSWDITKLRGPGKYTYYYLYVILDVYSRYVVGWCVEYRESAEIAEALILDACLKQRIERGQLTLHADRGSAMTSKWVAQLLCDLGVEKSHSRPHISNDNPHSKAQFKTLKYRPDFPEMFGSIEDARSFCRGFFAWYNQEHRHSGIAMLTPATVHYGKAEETIAKRQSVLEAAYAAHPDRFVHHAPRHEALPPEFWINAPETDRAKVAPGATLLQ